jgi:hypothetical protein
MGANPRGTLSLTLYDFHASVRTSGTEGVKYDFSSRISEIVNSMDEFGWTAVDSATGQIVEQQNGVFRVNCLDWSVVLVLGVIEADSQFGPHQLYTGCHLFNHPHSLPGEYRISFGKQPNTLGCSSRTMGRQRRQVEQDVRGDGRLEYVYHKNWEENICGSFKRCHKECWKVGTLQLNTSKANGKSVYQQLPRQGQTGLDRHATGTCCVRPAGT